MMKAILQLLFLLLVCNLQAQEDMSQMEISIPADCEPLTTIAGCVNVDSGHFFQIAKDFTGHTVDPLQLVRSYDSSNLMETFLGTGCGSQFPLMASEIQKGARHAYAMISERDGFLVPYRGKTSHGEQHCQIDPRLLQRGYTNLNRVNAGARANFVNWLAVFNPHSKDRWVVQLGDGTQRIYGKVFKLGSLQRQQIVVPTDTVYLLTEEVKPNGNRVKYSYQNVDGKPYLSKVWTENRTGEVTLNSLEMTYTSEGCQLKSSCGKTVDYIQQTKSCYFPIGEGTLHKKFLKAVDSSQTGSTFFKMEGNQNLPRVTRVDKG